MDSSYKVDEGYSEETRSQDGLESPMKMESGPDDTTSTQMELVSGLGLLTLSESERGEIAYTILRTLRAATIANVVDRLWPLFHKDPIAIFPPEIMSQIFSYLSPSMLLEASQASRAWRERILDSRLWKHKFRTEGWLLDTEEVQRFERDYNRVANVAKQEEKKASSHASRQQLATPNNRRQPSTTSTPYRINARAKFRTNSMKQLPEPDSMPVDRSHQGSVSDQKQLFDTDNIHSDHPRQESNYDQDMPDVDYVSARSGDNVHNESLGERRLREFFELQEDQDVASPDPPALDDPRLFEDSPSGRRPGYLDQPLMIYMGSGQATLNYHNVYKQKRKLEENWNTGQFKSFQLPHRDYPGDAHTECVYTIQYSGNHLVSGSRDRTLRIWDLDTQRLVRQPLHGHTGSVLCLQFDDRKEEDIIISGSSDESVILWQFSTGKMIKRILNAHRESVLNLKFDNRFLITCSKDKTIKIWNRRTLQPGHRDYPVRGVPGGGFCPSYIIDMKSMAEVLRGPISDQMLLEPYTHLITLDLHGAAVNAIQIFKDELVSASGDRNIRVWNIHTGECSTKMEAHAKGIACVQYDGKRIVSGSSDKTIRIFDPISKTEVARLEGHTNLVRTIQAAFADPPGGREMLEAEAAEVRRQWQAASLAGAIPTESSRKLLGTPGSRKPKDIRSLGAKIPPSGGGSKWGRIVSGSYDETIIIWKKTEDDEWVIGLRLRQEEALRAAGPPLSSRSDAQAQIQVNPADPANIGQANQLPPNQPLHQAAAVHGPLPAHQLVSDAAQAGPASLHPGHNSAQQGWQNPHLARAYQQIVQNQQNSATGSRMNSPAINSLLQIHQQQVGDPASSQQNGSQSPAQQQPIPQPANQHARPPRPPGTHAAQAHVGQPNARVFKLQFDARRIICCSQDPKIVGWDFANGDEQIVKCSRFFAPPQ